MTNYSGQPRTLEQYVESLEGRIKEQDLVGNMIYNAMFLRREGNPVEALATPVSATILAARRAGEFAVSLSFLTTELKAIPGSSLDGVMLRGLWRPAEPGSEFSEGHIAAYEDGLSKELDGHEADDPNAFDWEKGIAPSGSASKEFANVLAVPMHAAREFSAPINDAPLRSAPSSTPFRYNI